MRSVILPLSSFPSTTLGTYDVQRRGWAQGEVHAHCSQKAKETTAGRLVVSDNKYYEQQKSSGCFVVSSSVQNILNYQSKYCYLLPIGPLILFCFFSFDLLLLFFLSSFIERFLCLPIPSPPKPKHRSTKKIAALPHKRWGAINSTC